MMRVRAGISYALAEAMEEGHCGLPTDELLPLAAALLEIPKELIATALDLAGCGNSASGMGDNLIRCDGQQSAVWGCAERMSRRGHCSAT
jgi:hypothetical protein